MRLKPFINYFLATFFFIVFVPAAVLLDSCNSGKENSKNTVSVTSTKVEDKIAEEPSSPFEDMVSTLESNDRVIWQKPELVMTLLGDNLNEKTVADIGAGSGYFSFRILPMAKKVIGIEIDRRFISFMDSLKVRQPNYLQNRFEARLAQPDNPRLKDAEADAVLIVNTYSYIENRVAYMSNLLKGMSKGAKLLIIDFKKKNIPIGPPQEVKLDDRQVSEELRKAGFRSILVDDKTLDYQYIVTALK